jgi:uncharacterized membrane protein YkoI
MRKALLLAFLLAWPGAAHAKKAEAHQAKVPIETARKTALERVKGTVKAEELEKEHGRWIYSFQIKPEGEEGKTIKEVNVDADTGEVVSVETEKD